jgi:hypothetical protein
MIRAFRDTWELGIHSYLSAQPTAPCPEWTAWPSRAV